MDELEKKKLTKLSCFEPDEVFPEDLLERRNTKTEDMLENRLQISPKKTKIELPPLPKTRTEKLEEEKEVMYDPWAEDEPISGSPGKKARNSSKKKKKIESGEEG